MLATEYYDTREDGVRLVRTYSTLGRMISHDGALYEEAIDPEDSGRTYTETNVSIDDGGEAERADYEAALTRLGVSV